nr:hypothetical protein [Mycoplasmopsis bovis]
MIKVFTESLYFIDLFEKNIKNQLLSDDDKEMLGWVVMFLTLC